MAHILIIEDDEVLSDQLRETLTDVGHQVVECVAGETAVAYVKLGKPVDLVLTDVRMEGMGGLAALEELRRLLPRLRGIVMTGYASDEAPGRAVRAGAWDYLYKPFGQEQLIRAIDHVVEAEKHQEQTHNRLGGLFEGMKRWLKRATGGDLESLRERAYRAFHAGIRSRLLERKRALTAWDELERIERLFQQQAAAAQLEKEYRQVLHLMAGLQSSSTEVVDLEERTPEKVPVRLFDAFFRRIVRGELPLHLIRTALPMRLVSAEQLVGNPGLREAVEEVWGPL